MQSSIQEIIIRERFEELDQQDLITLKAWRDSSKSNELHYQNQIKIFDDYLLAERYNEIDVDAAWNSVESQLEIKARPIKKNRNWLAIAAMILLTLSFGIYFYSNQESKPNLNPIALDVNPGGNRATLTLANGNTINLSDTQSGIIIGTNDITYENGNTVGANLRVRPNDIHSPEYLSLSTPKGGQYQITLPDGTKAWLNAASKLGYPSHFTGKDRRVELTGEAYFEVAKNTKQPFIVTSAGQEVTVLGTQFNINAYSDEPDIKTTLVEGSVSVRPLGIQHESQSTILIPGQQSIISGNTIQVKTVNTEEFVAWKDNLFLFHNIDLKSIMLQLSRWYNFNIDINNIPDAHFYGEIPKDVQLSEVLKMLTESSGLHFKLIEKGTTNKERRMIIEK